HLYLALSPPRPRPDLPSFPTRRSSDLGMPYVCCSIGVARDRRMVGGIVNAPLLEEHFEAWPGHFVFIDRRGRHTRADPGPSRESDRKSTRLNSSHVSISYAVFCLKKKN